MNLELGAIRGITIAGAAAAYPSDLTTGVTLNAYDVYGRLLGEGWERALIERAWDPARAAEWGVTHRDWTRGTDLSSFDLALEAARRALQRAAVDAGDVELIVCATCTPPTITASLAGQVARALGTDAAALDVRAGGAGGLDAWVSAASYHAQGCRTSLVIAAETSSRYLAAEDLGNALLFGDGAGALVLQSDGGRAGLESAMLGNATLTGRPFTVPGALPPSAEMSYVFQAPDAAYLAGLADLWRKAGSMLGPCEVRLPYAVHAAQVRAAVGDGYEARHALSHLDRRGCLGCAGPLALVAETWSAGSLPPGTSLGSVAVGGGVAWSALTWLV